MKSKGKDKVAEEKKPYRRPDLNDLTKSYGDKYKYNLEDHMRKWNLGDPNPEIAKRERKLFK